MKSVTIEYATISPAVLDLEIREATCNALCMWKELDEQYFQFDVMGWLPLTTRDLVKIEDVLAKYV